MGHAKLTRYYVHNGDLCESPETIKRAIAFSSDGDIKSVYLAADLAPLLADYQWLKEGYENGWLCYSEPSEARDNWIERKPQ